MSKIFVWFLFFQIVRSTDEFVSKDEFRSYKEETKIRMNTLAAALKDISSVITDLKREITDRTTNTNVEGPLTFDTNMLNDTTIEERVTVLEFQVENLILDVTEQGEDLDLVEEEVAAVIAGQVVQDERILELEGNTDGLSDSVSALEASDEEQNSELVALDNRVTSMNTTLSDTVLEVAELDTGVEMLDTRVSRLEVDGTFAFHAALGEYTSIPVNTVIVFPQLIVNVGNGYDNTTGQFTVPAGGDGLYYFRVHGLSSYGEYAGILIRKNEAGLCYTFGDGRATTYDSPACGAVVQLSEGDIVDTTILESMDDTPLYSTTSTTPYNSFSGFRIAPQ